MALRVNRLEGARSCVVMLAVMLAIVLVVVVPLTPTQYSYPARNCVGQFSPSGPPRTGFHIVSCARVIPAACAVSMHMSPELAVMYALQFAAIPGCLKGLVPWASTRPWLRSKITAEARRNGLEAGLEVIMSGYEG